MRKMRTLNKWTTFHTASFFARPFANKILVPNSRAGGAKNFYHIFVRMNDKEAKNTLFCPKERTFSKAGGARAKENKKKKLITILSKPETRACCFKIVIRVDYSKKHVTGSEVFCVILHIMSQCKCMQCIIRLF